MFKRACVFLLLAIILAMNVAAMSAFDKYFTSPATELIDDTEDQGGNNHPIEFVEGYGIGYTFYKDFVVLRDVDFGANGADKMTIGFGYGVDDPCTIEVYIDNKDGAPSGSFAITNTGGWGEEAQQPFTTDIRVPGGVHTIFIKWASKASGSLYTVQFNEAPAAHKAEESAPASAANTTPETDDITGLFVLSAILAASAFVLVKKPSVKTK